MNFVVSFIANSSKHGFLQKLFLCLICAIIVAPFASAADSDTTTTNPANLADLDIEKLLNMEVTSVSRHSEKLSNTSAAVSVLTHEDIRRSGLNSIPEILRMAVGMEVAHIDSSKWAISARGFNDRFANKLLVLIDGRSVYDPLFSGVWWDVQDMVIDDIDRIEIIRGPGASMWGANAVNGVVNIITKKTTDSVGNHIVTAYEYGKSNSNLMKLTGNVGSGAFRIYSKTNNNDGFSDSSGSQEPDAWQVKRTGFRMDVDMSASDSLLVQGESYTGTGKQILEHWSYFPPYHVPLTFTGGLSGRNCMLRLNRSKSTGSSQFQVYFDHTERHDGIMKQTRDTVDLDLQSSFSKDSKNNFVWGVGYRTSVDDLWSNEIVKFARNKERESLASGFIQDEISIIPHQLQLVLGTKVEHNNFTGCEFQPNARLSWQPSKKEMFWTAVSHATRTPSRFERTFSYYDINEADSNGYPIMTVITGNPSLKSENITAYEIGHRILASEQFSLDTTAYYNVYNNFTSYEEGQSYIEDQPIPHVIQPLILHNGMNARTYGLELSANYRLLSNWRITAGYTTTNLNMIPDEGSTDTMASTYSGRIPHNQFSIRSHLDLPHHLEFDTMLYHVGSLSYYQVPAYNRVDARLGWTGGRNMEISIGVRNLLADHHLEFGGGALSVGATEAKRESYANITYRF